MIQSESYYELLGVSQAADAKTLRKAFHRLSKDLHPDTTSLPIQEASQRFRQVCEAYEFLSDSSRRELYDKSLGLKNLESKRSFGSKELSSRVSIETKVQNAQLRPFSGGELFSLLLLCIALLLSLLVALGFALLDGRQLQVLPSWLSVEQSLPVSTSATTIDVGIPSKFNAFKSTLISST